MGAEQGIGSADGNDQGGTEICRAYMSELPQVWLYAGGKVKDMV